MGRYVMQISDNGVNFIKRFEGLRLTAYLDVAGVPTIGYGHTHTVTRADAASGMTISEETAEYLLRVDLKRYERRVRSYVKVPLNQNEFDALVSFDFNTGALHRSTALLRLNRGEREDAAEALTWWNRATIDGRKVEVLGLVRRRRAERELFLAPAQKAATPA